MKRLLIKILGLHIRKDMIITHEGIFKCLQKGADTSCNKYGVKVSQHIIFEAQRNAIMDYLIKGYV